MNTDKLVSIMATLIILTSWYVAMDTIAGAPEILHTDVNRVIAKNN